MTDTVYVDYSAPVVNAAWLNDLNKLAYQGLLPTYGTTTGSANAQVLTLPATSLLAALTSNLFIFKAGFANTGGMTLSIVITGGATLGPYAVQMTSMALVGGEVGNGTTNIVMFNGTNFQLVSTPAVMTNATNATNAANLLNTASPKLPTITVTQASGALTFAVAAQYIDFRNTTLTSGTPSTINAAPANLVLPSGGTLGFPTTVQGRMVLVEMNNAGTAELAVASIAGGIPMNEEGVISTTAINASSTAANVWYSTTARTNLPYKVIGAVDAVNTAGAWGNPVAVINAGGEALAALDKQTIYTPNVTPVLVSGNQLIGAAHTMGVIPAYVALEYVCLTAEQNFSVGDVVLPNAMWNGSVVNQIMEMQKSTTNVGFWTPTGYAVMLHNKTTTAAFTPTAANWAYRFALRRN